MGRRTDIRWAVIEREYVRCERDVSCVQLGQKHGVSAAQIGRHCQKGKWLEKRRAWRERHEAIVSEVAVSRVAEAEIDWQAAAVEARKRHAEHLKLLEESVAKSLLGAKGKARKLHPAEAAQYAAALARAIDAEAEVLRREPLSGPGTQSADDGVTTDELCQRLLDAAAKLPGGGDPGAAPG